MQSRWRAGGFTLIELVLALGVASILAAMFVPGLMGVGHLMALRSTAHRIAAQIASAREAAISSGRCVLIARVSPTALVAARADDTDCRGASGVDADGPTLTGGVTRLPALSVRLGQPSRLSLPTVPTASDPVLVWQPNGWLRGNNLQSTNITDDTWRLTVRTTLVDGGSRDLEVVVTPAGLVCVNEQAGGPCP